MSALSEAKFNELLFANEKTSKRMSRVGLVGLIPSLLLSPVIVGLPFVVVFGTTALIGVIRKARPPKAGKYYVAPGVIIGILEMILGGVLWTLGMGGDVHYYAVLTLGSLLMGLIFGIVGVSVLLAGLTRTSVVNQTTAAVQGE